MPHRYLKPGEVIPLGAEYQDRYTREWHRSKCAGSPCGVPNRTSMKYRVAIGRAKK